MLNYYRGEFNSLWFFVFVFVKRMFTHTYKGRDSSNSHPCTIAPSTLYSRGSAPTVAYAGSSTAFPPWPNHPGREAYPDRKTRGCGWACGSCLCVCVCVCLSLLSIVWLQCSASSLRERLALSSGCTLCSSLSLPKSLADCCLRAVPSRSLSPPTPPADYCLPALLRR